MKMSCKVSQSTLLIMLSTEASMVRSLFGGICVNVLSLRMSGSSAKNRLESLCCCEAELSASRGPWNGEALGQATSTFSNKVMLYPRGTVRLNLKSEHCCQNV